MIEFLYRHPEGYLEACCILFDIILIVFSFIQASKKVLINRIFRTLLIEVTALTFFEVLSNSFLKDMQSGTLSSILIDSVNSILYICICLVGSTIYVYFISRFRIKIHRYLAATNKLLIALYCVIMIANIFTGIVSSYSFEEGIYIHGPLFIWVGYMIPMYFYALALIFFIKNYKIVPKKFKISMILLTITLTLAMILQPTLGSSISVSGLFASLGIMIIYFTLETEDYENLYAETDKLMYAKIKAGVASRAKNQFLANMSHEIRTPLNAILGLDDMILNTTQDEETKKSAMNIASAGDALLSIIDNVLDISQIESGEFKLEEKKYHFAQILQDVKIIISNRSEAKKLKFKMDIDQDMPERLIGDPVRIRQIIINILNNSVKYTNSGSIMLKVRGQQNNDELTITMEFSDTGIGIKKEDLGKLFDSYSRVDTDTNRNVEGTGLGLSIVKQIVDKLNGHIEVSSVYKKGTTFTVRFSQKIYGAGSIKEYDPIAKATKKHNGKFTCPEAKILVVDDNEMNLKIASAFLKAAKPMTIDKASGGKEAIEMADNTKYDIIYLDAFMPEIDGPQVLKHIKENDDCINHYTPILVLTADAMAGARENYLNMGFDEYLSKPVNRESLLKSLTEFLPEELIVEE